MNTNQSSIIPSPAALGITAARASLFEVFISYEDANFSQVFKFEIPYECLNKTVDEIFKNYIIPKIDKFRNLEVVISDYIFYTIDSSIPFFVDPIRHEDIHTKLNEFLPNETKMLDIIITPKSYEVKSYLSTNLSNFNSSYDIQSFHTQCIHLIKSHAYTDAYLAYKTLCDTIGSESPLIYSCQIKYYLKTKRYHYALALAQNAITKYISDRDLRRLYSISLQKIGKYDQAIESFTRLNLMKPTCYPESQYYIAKVYYEMGAIDQAYTLILPVVKTKPDNLKAQLLLAKTRAKQGYFIESLDIALNNFYLHPDHKATREFFGFFVRTPLQASYLLSEIGESILDPNTIFFLSDSTSLINR